MFPANTDIRRAAILANEINDDRATLLAIVERQAGEMAETRRARDAANERLEVAPSEVERLRAELDKVAARAMGVHPL